MSANSNSGTSVNFTELSSDSQRDAIQARLHDLEAQYFQLSLKVEAPALGEVAVQADQDNLDQLQKSIETLRNRENSLPAASQSEPS